MSFQQQNQHGPLWEAVRFFSGGSDFHPEDGFNRMLCIERERMERSRLPFMLLLLNVEDLMPGSDEDLSSGNWRPLCPPPPGKRISRGGTNTARSRGSS